MLSGRTVGVRVAVAVEVVRAVAVAAETSATVSRRRAVDRPALIRRPSRSVVHNRNTEACALLRTLCLVHVHVLLCSQHKVNESTLFAEGAQG